MTVNDVKTHALKNPYLEVKYDTHGFHVTRNIFRADPGRAKHGTTPCRRSIGGSESYLNEFPNENLQKGRPHWTVIYSCSYICHGLPATEVFGVAERCC